MASILAQDPDAISTPCADTRELEPGRYLLKDLPKPDCELVFQTGDVLQFANRDYLLRQGAVADGIHIILSGVVESVCVGPQGRELMLATWQKGDFVGAPYVLGDHHHMWSARAFGTVESLYLQQSAIRQLIAESSAFAIKLIECLGFKGEAYSTLAQTLAGQKVSERLCLLLVKLCENASPSEDGGILLGRITHANMARMIGATRQSISLVLSRLQDEGVISIGPATTVVHDLASLRRQVGD